MSEPTNRLAYSLDELVRQVEAATGDIPKEYGDPDGLGVIRYAKFDGPAAKLLADSFKANGVDHRISGTTNARGTVTVTMVSDISADERGAFDLVEAKAKGEKGEKGEKDS